MASPPSGKTVTEEFKGKTIESLDQWLTSYGIPTASYGLDAAKPLNNLWTEIIEGETILRLEDGKPLRLVSVMNVLIRNKQDKLLYEARQILPTGTARVRNMPLAEKMLPGESWQDAVIRAVKEELGPVLNDPENPDVAVLPETYEQRVESRNSQSYPGLSSQYICHRVEARVPGLPEGDFQTSEEREDGTLVHCWEWK